MSNDDNDRRIPSAMLFPFAFVQSRLFWVYSVIWTLYTQLSSDDAYTKEQPPSEQRSKSKPDEHPHATTRKTNRRLRGHSAPPSSQTSLAQQQQRERGSTISAESPSTSLSRQRLFLANSDVILRPLPQDERIGTTCPPQWWQKTCFYLDARKRQLMASVTASTPGPLLSLSPFSTESVERETGEEVVIPTEQQAPHPFNTNTPAPVTAGSVKRAASKRKWLLGILNHHHSLGKRHFWKKKTEPVPAL